MSADELRAAAREAALKSRREQGLPDVVQDPGAYGALAQLLAPSMDGSAVAGAAMRAGLEADNPT